MTVPSPLQSQPHPPSPDDAPDPIRVLIVDDHPAVRAAAAGVLEDAPDITAVAVAIDGPDGLRQARRLRPDVVVLDYSLPGEDGLSLVSELTLLRPRPRVLLYSAFAGPAMGIAAILAGADGALAKTASADALREGVRAVAAGEKSMPPLPAPAMLALAAHLDNEDARLCAMLVEGASARETARALSVSEEWIDARRWAILRQLRPLVRAR
ncbi:MAG TPA: response regulator transcription factor [Solirubrobacteraceae bacterium]|nr:response regulator transcription factor [Solirubrobacteraceae bacterium]